jgi:hypothetical protein
VFHIAETHSVVADSYHAMPAAARAGAAPGVSRDLAAASPTPATSAGTHFSDRRATD